MKIFLTIAFVIFGMHIALSNSDAAGKCTTHKACDLVMCGHHYCTDGDNVTSSEKPMKCKDGKEAKKMECHQHEHGGKTGGK